jgi:serine/threonine protein kinase
MFTEDTATGTPTPLAQEADPLDATACGDLTEKLEGTKAPLPPLTFGQTLGKCLLTEVLGRGGWCTVFRALHQTLNINVAIKVLNLVADDPVLPQAREQLRREGQLLARLHHPHVVRVFDFDDDIRLPFLVLECVDGPSLRDLIVQNGRLHAKRARMLMRQVAHGLAIIGATGAVHRDIKPANILLTRDGNAKIADFGQVAFVQSAAESPPGSSTEVTGTVSYVAPEQFLTPGEFDQRSDLYSLGVTFYEAVTGRLPFQGKSRMEILLKHAEEKPIPPTDLVPDLEPSLSELILMLLAKDPNDRPRDAAEVCAALVPPRPKPPSLPPPPDTTQIPNQFPSQPPTQEPNQDANQSSKPIPASGASAVTDETDIPRKRERRRKPGIIDTSIPVSQDRSVWAAFQEWLGVRPRAVDHQWRDSMQRTLFSPAQRESKPSASSELPTE